jgi:hypothetical protein
MLHTCADICNMMGNLENFLHFKGSKHGPSTPRVYKASTSPSGLPGHGSAALRVLLQWRHARIES